jgi:hypothetical protein
MSQEMRPKDYLNSASCTSARRRYEEAFRVLQRLCFASEQVAMTCRTSDVVLRRVPGRVAPDPPRLALVARGRRIRRQTRFLLGLGEGLPCDAQKVAGYHRV